MIFKRKVTFVSPKSNARQFDSRKKLTITKWNCNLKFISVSKFRKNTLYCDTFIEQLVLPQVHSPFQSQFSTGSELVLPLSNCSTFSFP